MLMADYAIDDDRLLRKQKIFVEEIVETGKILYER
jgi:hypothetical protein